MINPFPPHCDLHIFGNGRVQTFDLDFVFGKLGAYAVEVGTGSDNLGPSLVGDGGLAVVSVHDRDVNIAPKGIKLQLFTKRQCSQNRFLTFNAQSRFQRSVVFVNIAVCFFSKTTDQRCCLSCNVIRHKRTPKIKREFSLPAGKENSRRVGGNAYRLKKRSVCPIEFFLISKIRVRKDSLRIRRNRHPKPVSAEALVERAAHSANFACGNCRFFDKNRNNLVRYRRLYGFEIWRRRMPEPEAGEP